MNHIDLNQPPPNHTFSVSVNREETDSERREVVQGFGVVCGGVGVCDHDCCLVLRNIAFCLGERRGKEVGNVDSFRYHQRLDRLFDS